jgi:uncharacterized protein YbaP (TraB family)
MARARCVAASALLCLLAAAPVAGSAAERFGQGLLWRIEGKGAAPSHVFGTIHLADSRVTALPHAVARELRQARSVVLEARLDAASLQLLAARMLYTDGRDLAAVAGDELFRKAVAVAGGIGLPEPLLLPLKPWAAALMLSVPPQNTADVLDVMLARIATEQGKPLHELEGVEEQVAVFERMPESEQVAMLRQAVDNYESMPRLIGRVVEAYLARDLAGIWRIREASSGKSEEARRFHETIVRRLLHDRNGRMAERSEPRLQEGGAFIAVGALHLYGERGVLALLESRGWRVTRVY